MKKKGFTLIELIVVIAIIGVLAAILVPAMLGYVRKSKVTTANTTAKSIYNAFNTSLVDLDSQDVAINNFSTITNQDGATYVSGATNSLATRVNTYFSDIAKVSDFSVQITNGACVACAVKNGIYAGSYPHAMTVDIADSFTSSSSSSVLSYALNG